MLRSSDLLAALDHLRGAQRRFECWPNCLIIVNGFAFSMRNDQDAFTSWTNHDGELVCDLPSDLLTRILNREEHWNNAELGCHITFERKGPYMPDVHTLLCFFHKAAP